MGEEKKQLWNSLEIAKLVAQYLIPISVAVIGFYVQQELAKQTRISQHEEKIADRRLQVYDQIRVPLNRIYCFINDKGSWKEDNPETVIAFKRQVDREMYSQQAVWGADVFQAYLKFMDSAFASYQGVASDAKVKTDTVQKKLLDQWKDEWNERVTGSIDPENDTEYRQLMVLLSRDIGADDSKAR
ncbi:hypothetical protein [Rhizobium sp. LjRoot258]|uniref:hypothetical protein n=1 Tax=Rhizobium sp. LjRoot258 TaxID=3342299 RepID=UPI003ED117A8